MEDIVMDAIAGMKAIGSDYVATKIEVDGEEFYMMIGNRTFYDTVVTETSVIDPRGLDSL